MLKFILDSIADLDPAVQALYVQDGGKYRLDIDGYQDPAALLRAKQHEKEAHQATKDQLKALKEQVDELQEQLDAAKAPKGRKDDAQAALEESWKKKLSDKEKELQATINQLTGYLERTHKDDVAMKLASELSDTPHLLLPFIKERLKFELGSSGPETRVLDGEGNLSASTVEELAKEFKTNAQYAAIIRGSQATGGGATNGGKTASGPQKPEDYSEADRVALARSNPAEFRRLFAQGPSRSATH